MKDFRNILKLTAICLIAAAGWWIRDYIPSTPAENPDKIIRHPDYSMDTFKLTTTSELGIPRYQLTAASMTHYPDEDHADLIKPLITFFRENESPWKIQSDRGTVSTDGKMVYLDGKVNIFRRESKNNKSVNIDTFNLHIHTDTGLAETTETTLVKSDEKKIMGKGMQAYFNDNKLRLLSNIRATYTFNSDKKQEN